MESQRDPPHTVVHIGSDAELVRTATAEAAVTDGADSVLSVDDVDDISSEHLSEARVVVCETATDLELLTAIRERDPQVPTLAVVTMDTVVDDALGLGATDVVVRRDSVDLVTLLSRRLEAVATAPVESPLISDSAAQLLDAIDDSFYSLAPDGTLRGWNEQFREITGYEAAELAGMSALEFFAGADKARIADAIETVIETGSATVEAELVAKDGTTTPVEYTGRLVTNADGTPEGIVGIGRGVSDRREREDRLVRLRQAIETIADSVPLTLFEVEADGTVSMVRGETLSQHLPQQLKRGVSVTDAFADHPQLREDVDAALDGEPMHGLVTVADATLETWLQPALDGTGSVKRVIGLALDVTEREERASMLDQIQATAGEVIWMSTPEKESMDFITDSYADIWGRTPETLETNPTSFVEAIHSDDRDRVDAALADQQNAPDDYEETYRVVHPDGTVRWVHDQSAGVYEDGELTRIVGIAADITVQKDREQELQLKNRTIETAPVGIAIHETTTPDSQITYVNTQFESITGYDHESIIGTGVSTLGGADTDTPRLDEIGTAVDTGDYCSATVVLHRPDGTPYWGRIDVAPVVRSDGDVTHAVSFVQDVTERKEHEQEIERHLADYGEVLAEDLGAPLAEAQDALETARTDGTATDLQRAAQAVETAVSLVDDLATVHSFSVEPRRVSESIQESHSAPTRHNE